MMFIKDYHTDDGKREFVGLRLIEYVHAWAGMAIMLNAFGGDFMQLNDPGLPHFAMCGAPMAHSGASRRGATIAGLT